MTHAATNGHHISNTAANGLAVNVLHAKRKSLHPVHQASGSIDDVIVIDEQQDDGHQQNGVAQQKRPRLNGSHDPLSTWFDVERRPARRLLFPAAPSKQLHIRLQPHQHRQWGNAEQSVKEERSESDDVSSSSAKRQSAVDQSPTASRSTPPSLSRLHVSQSNSLQQVLSHSSSVGLYSPLQLQQDLSLSEQLKFYQRYTVLHAARASGKRATWLPERVREDCLALSIAQTVPGANTKFRAASAVDTMMSSVSAPMTNTVPAITLHLYQLGCSINNEEKNYHSYSEREIQQLLRSIDAGELPAAVWATWSSSKHVQYYDGAVLCELRDYRNIQPNGTSKDDAAASILSNSHPRVTRLLLRPTTETIQQSVLQHTVMRIAEDEQQKPGSSDTGSDTVRSRVLSDALQLEQHILCFTRRDICLLPNVRVCQIKNVLHYNLLKTNVGRLTRTTAAKMVEEMSDAVGELPDAQETLSTTAKDSESEYQQFIVQRRKWLRDNRPDKQSSIAATSSDVSTSNPPLLTVWNDETQQVDYTWHIDDDFLQTMTDDELQGPIQQLLVTLPVVTPEDEAPRDSSPAQPDQQPPPASSPPPQAEGERTAITATGTAPPRGDDPTVLLSDRGHLFNPPPQLMSNSTRFNAFKLKQAARTLASPTSKNKSTDSRQQALLQFASYAHHMQFAVKDTTNNALTAANTVAQLAYAAARVKKDDSAVDEPMTPSDDNKTSTHNAAANTVKAKLTCPTSELLLQYASELRGQRPPVTAQLQASSKTRLPPTLRASLPSVSPLLPAPTQTLVYSYVTLNKLPKQSTHELIVSHSNTPQMDDSGLNSIQINRTDYDVARYIGAVRISTTSDAGPAKHYCYSMGSIRTAASYVQAYKTQSEREAKVPAQPTHKLSVNTLTAEAERSVLDDIADAVTKPTDDIPDSGSATPGCVMPITLPPPPVQSRVSAGVSSQQQQPSGRGRPPAMKTMRGQAAHSERSVAGASSRSVPGHQAQAQAQAVAPLQSASVVSSPMPPPAHYARAHTPVQPPQPTQIPPSHNRVPSLNAYALPQSHPPSAAAPASAVDHQQRQQQQQMLMAAARQQQADIHMRQQQQQQQQQLNMRPTSAASTAPPPQHHQQYSQQAPGGRPQYAGNSQQQSYVAIDQSQRPAPHGMAGAKNNMQPAAAAQQPQHRPRAASQERLPMQPPISQPPSYQQHAHQQPTHGTMPSSGHGSAPPGASQHMHYQPRPPASGQPMPSHTNGTMQQPPAARQHPMASPTQPVMRHVPPQNAAPALPAGGGYLPPQQQQQQQRMAMQQSHLQQQTPPGQVQRQANVQNHAMQQPTGMHQSQGRPYSADVAPPPRKPDAGPMQLPPGYNAGMVQRQQIQHQQQQHVQAGASAGSHPQYRSSQPDPPMHAAAPYAHPQQAHSLGQQLAEQQQQLQQQRNMQQPHRHPAQQQLPMQPQQVQYGNVR